MGFQPPTLIRDAVKIPANKDAVGEVLNLKASEARDTSFSDRDTREPVCHSLDVDRSRGSHMLQSGLLLTAIARTT